MMNVVVECNDAVDEEEEEEGEGNETTGFFAMDIVEYLRIPIVLPPCSFVSSSQRRS